MGLQAEALRMWGYSGAGSRYLLKRRSAPRYHCLRLKQGAHHRAICGTLLRHPRNVSRSLAHWRGFVSGRKPSTYEISSPWRFARSNKIRTPSAYMIEPEKAPSYLVLTAVAIGLIGMLREAYSRREACARERLGDRPSRDRSVLKPAGCCRRLRGG